MKERAVSVVSNLPVAFNTYEMVFESAEEQVFKAGQFLNISVEGFTLKRPFAIKWHKNNGKLFSMVYVVVGEGTDKLTTLKTGDIVSITYPLGNGFVLDEPKRIALVGGGVGVSPLESVRLAYPHAEYKAYYGFKTSDWVPKGLDAVICTDDGSCGYHGNSVEAFYEREDADSFDYILVCGPKPMMKAMKLRSEGVKTPILVSLEERMGCGIGACLTCVCKVNGENKRVCRDGPVFGIWEAEI